MHFIFIRKIIVSAFVLALILIHIPYSHLEARSGFFLKNEMFTCDIQKLSTKRIRKIFHCDNPVKILMIHKNYQALNITIKNKSHHDMILDPKDITLPITQQLSFKRKVTMSPLLIPLIVGIGSAALLCSGLGFATIPSAIAGTTFGVTALNTQTGASNKISIKNIQRYLLDERHPTLIAKSTILKKIIFIPRRKFKKTFDLTLRTKKYKKCKTITVTLP